MDISAVNSTINVYDINAVSQANAAGSSSAVSTSDATTSRVSGSAKWMSELVDLQWRKPSAAAWYGVPCAVVVGQRS